VAQDEGPQREEQVLGWEDLEREAGLRGVTPKGALFHTSPTGKRQGVPGKGGRELGREGRRSTISRMNIEGWWGELDSEQRGRRREPEFP